MYIVLFHFYVVFFFFHLPLTKYLNYIYMSKLRVLYKKQELLTIRENLDSPTLFHRCGVILCFVYLRSVSCVSTIAFVSGLSILHLSLSLACPFFICLCLWLVHSSFAFVSGLSILHLPLSLACPFFICLCLWLVHSSFVFVSGLSILHLPLSLACPFFICLCLWLVNSSFAFGFL